MAKLYFRYGTMNAGKSLHLLAAAHSYESTGRSVLCLVPKTAGTTRIESRTGIGRSAQVLSADGREIDYGYYDCILVDEAQFLNSWQIAVLSQTALKKDVPVICFGLKTDFQANLFPGSAELLAHADDIQEIKSVCSRCHRKALFNMRIDENGKRVLNGETVETDKSRYIAVCKECYWNG